MYVQAGIPINSVVNRTSLESCVIDIVGVEIVDVVVLYLIRLLSAQYCIILKTAILTVSLSESGIHSALGNLSNTGIASLSNVNALRAMSSNASSADPPNLSDIEAGTLNHRLLEPHSPNS